MFDKNCLLTGATSGIGQAAAIALAKEGYRLFLVARNPTRASATEQLIRLKAKDAEVHWLMGDLASLVDVRNIAETFLSFDCKLDLLFLNAGVTYNRRTCSQDGYEMMFAVNHLAPFTLTHLLMDKLVEGKHDTRVVITASGAYSFVNGLNIDDLNAEKKYSSIKAYGHSKLANILFTHCLDERLHSAVTTKHISVNCFHPGFVGTNLGTQTPLGKIIMRLIKPFSRSSAKGADTGLFLALEEFIENSGGYYFNRKKKQLPFYAKDPEAAKALWEQSCRLADLTPID